MDLLSFKPVGPGTQKDLERFSLAHGKFRYCSCMRWRLTSGAFKRSTKETRVVALKEAARRGAPVGLLAYLDGEPVGWCSIAPRETYAGLERYRALARIDAKPVWSVVCFFLDRRLRGQNATQLFLEAAVDYAASHGAAIVEGYPVKAGALYAYMGSIGTFQRAGFCEVTPKGAVRPIMRRQVGRVRLTKAVCATP